MLTVLGFYKFKKLTLLHKKKSILQKAFTKHDVRGTLILSKEGLNCTISGKSKNVSLIKNKVKILFKIKMFDSENLLISKFQPFYKPKIKIKNEVVPMNFNIFNTKKKKNYLEPAKWNKLLKNKNTFVLDVRKPFEYDVGTFKKAINPKVNNFRDFPKYLSKLNKNVPVAMFCTGGIRCEKASVFLNQKGFHNIFQLKGGILNYLKKVNKKVSM